MKEYSVLNQNSRSSPTTVLKRFNCMPCTHIGIITIDLEFDGLLACSAIIMLQPEPIATLMFSR